MNWSWPKLNIRRRVLIMVLASSIFTFLVMSAIGLYGMYYTKKNIAEQGVVTGDISAQYTRGVVEELSTTSLSNVAKARAEQLDHELADRAEDATLIAWGVTEILTHPDRFLPRSLADPRREKIHSGQPYVWYAPGLEESLTPEARREIGLVANVASLLIPMADGNHERTAYFLGSERGYFIGVDFDPDNEIIEGFDTQMQGFDPRERPWYIRPTAGETYTFSEAFVGVEGFASVTAVAPYYDANGFAGVVGVEAGAEFFSDLTTATAVGSNGFSMALDSQGRVVYSPRGTGELTPSRDYDLRTSPEATLAEAARKMTGGETGIMAVNVDGEEYYLAFAPMPTIGWSFGTLIDCREIQDAAQESREVILAQSGRFIKEMRHRFYDMLAAVILALILLLVIIFFLSEKAARRFSRPIKTLSDGVREIAGGNLDQKLDIRTGDELEHLAVCFNAMTDELKIYMENLTRATAERERAEAELNIAAAIQGGLLPQTFPPFPGRLDFAIYATMHPARDVGGDFYDFYLLDDKHLVFTIADVSGKGVGAAIFMSRAMTILKNFATLRRREYDMAAVLAAANNQLCQGNENDMFVTVFLGMLDTDTGEFTYANGGHNPPLIKQGEGEGFAYMPPAGSCMLGIMEDVPFQEERLLLSSGAAVLLYTDGVTEAMNEEGQIFGAEALAETLQKTPPTSSPEEVIAAITKAVRAHVGAAEQSDDMTMLSIEYRGKLPQ
ncbi:MAG: SpoIIE family protein phosphatase [Selenomonadaceae bacterium]|nr:SpoIIE family protein phosphatase [Selenomonadaceae bacterium]